ncbi:unnamed protein product, partial [Prorocentrum cordatum]
MATWNCQRCFRVAKSQHNQCLCGQYRHHGWLAGYKGKGKGRGKHYPIAKRQPSRPRDHRSDRQKRRDTHSTGQLMEINRSILQKVASKIAMASPADATSHPEWVQPPESDDPLGVGKFQKAGTEHADIRNRLAMLQYATSLLKPLHIQLQNATRRKLILKDKLAANRTKVDDL